jgi:hypothetical protein
VYDNGCTDDTYEVANSARATMIRNTENKDRKILNMVIMSIVTTPKYLGIKCMKMNPPGNQKINFKFS